MAEFKIRNSRSRKPPSTREPISRGSTNYIAPVRKDENLDGLDDETGDDGKSYAVKNNVITETCKIFISPQSDPGSYIWVEKTRNNETGEFEGFVLKSASPVKDNLKVDWWVVEEE